MAKIHSDPFLPLTLFYREDKTLRQLLYGRKPYVYRVIYRIDTRRNLVNVRHIRHGARDEFEP